MKLSYNGVTLGIVRVLSCVRVPHYDPTGKDYLYTRWQLSVEATYSPQVGAGDLKLGVTAAGGLLEDPAATQTRTGSPRPPTPPSGTGSCSPGGCSGWRSTAASTRPPNPPRCGWRRRRWTSPTPAGSRATWTTARCPNSVRSRR